MAKLYVFGIGGTGSRVIRSLTMLLASGLETSVDEIVPIVVDPDSANADLTRTVMLMNDYVKIYSKLNFTQQKNGFFRTKITCELPNYTLLIQDTDDRKFRNFIGMPEMSKENKAMMEMLFSEKNLDANMNVGFKGNPNIGSVVLNQIVKSSGFETFANSFQQGDKIFIISSIFGGTGASGFPLLVKTLRTDQTIPNHSLINKAEIGAITLLPYFKLNQDENSEIDSSTFISKTKSALAYYEKNVAIGGQVNVLYFLGDNMVGSYQNHEGGSAQKNDAHLMEFLSATAIIDFCNEEHFEGESINKELGVGKLENKGSIIFSSFDDKIVQMIQRPMVQFTLMANCLIQKFKEVKGLNVAYSFSHNFFNSSYIALIRNFLELYIEWLKELKSNNRSLDLFNLDCGNHPFNLINGGTVFKWNELGTMGKSNYVLFYDRLNKTKDLLKGSDENNFLEMFFVSTKELCDKKLKI